jgi:ubiquinone/menaquinone biosynthesis C-methylase UbiE
MLTIDRSSAEPTATSEYESFAEIYSIWTGSAQSPQANLPFYVDAYVAAEGPAVELGIGDGRIAVEAARRGHAMVGVDRSPAMLEQCRERAQRAGVLDLLTLIQADFRSFELPEPAALIALPYHSIGHLQSLDDKSDALHHIYRQLRPGGRFIFDDFVMTPALMAHMRAVQLRAAYSSAGADSSDGADGEPGGTDRLLWVTSLIDEAAQSISVVTWEDGLDAAGTLLERRYRRLSLSWLEPAQARELLEDAGFTIETCDGDFERTEFDPASASEQVWTAHKGTA